jgi:branched-subunit amino acid ABC-type transport system permease component
MTAIWAFLHEVGFLLWLGGGLAAIVSLGALSRLDPPGLGGVTRVIVALHRWLLGPGVLITTASGLFLAFGMYRIEGVAEGGLSTSGTWVLVMIVSGLLAAIIAIVAVLPDASHLARLDPSAGDAQIQRALLQRLRRRTWLMTALALLAWLGGRLGS